MPPTDATAGTGPAPAHPGSTGPRADTTGPRNSPFGRFTVEDDDPDSEDTLDLHLTAEFVALRAGEAAGLLGRLAAWGPVATPAGAFQLVPVRIDQDLPLVHRWMNDPAVSDFWELAGSPDRTEAHLRAQLHGDGHCAPCLGVLDGIPMSYWEIYRADLDPLARRYPARPHDTGIHLLVGAAVDRGRGLGSALLRAVADLILDRRPACARVVAEPDLRNTPSVAAFLSAGFRFAAEIELPGKRAALMIRDRVLRDVM
ncbi:acetyltransferase [Streptomyces sp. 5-8]|uniref:Lysine N-acyltransferase MbtK n=1 Tax=Streptomyces musisoli TaxID=2802280 RepID=A0ABS1P8I0_9ACTN|nr:MULTISPECIES: GNAT family N-acetyltransferase [Streptomyces]MBL1108687.1 acetyltransferase [Streptomyces musisoli]MBY8842457.1 acetyltransferase [Streptomyces sp. SP2-10]